MQPLNMQISSLRISAAIYVMVYVPEEILPANPTSFGDVAGLAPTSTTR
jgi:hypothetical protein